MLDSKTSPSFTARYSERAARPASHRLWHGKSIPTDFQAGGGNSERFRTELTCVDQELIGDPGVIHIVDGGCKNGSEDFQIREDSLGWNNRDLSEGFYLPTAAEAGLGKQICAFSVGFLRQGDKAEIPDAAEIP